MEYECHHNPEPDDNATQWIVIAYETVDPVVEDDGRFIPGGRREVERFTCEDGPGFIAEARYCEEVPLEERWAADAEREQRGRMGTR